jgi:hypothetical protein
MSVEKVKRSGGDVWRVRWRDGQGRAHSRVVGRKADAVMFDAELKRGKRLGTTMVANTRETLSEFSRVWWDRHAKPNLQRHTLEHYASMLDVHIIPRLGNVPLRSLTPEPISEVRAELAAAGVRDPAIRKNLTLSKHPRTRGRVAAARIEPSTRDPQTKPTPHPRCAPPCPRDRRSDAHTPTRPAPKA